MNITPVNNYNNKVSFRHLVPRSTGLYRLEPQKLEKVLNNSEVLKFVRAYHNYGKDIYIDRYNDEIIQFSRRIVSDILNKLDHEYEEAVLKVRINELDKFNAREAIKELDKDYQEKFERLLSAKNPKSMLANFNYRLEK